MPRKRRLTKRQRFLIRSKAAKKGWVTRRKRLLSIAQLDEQFAALLAKEAELRQREEALMKKEADLKEQQKEMADRIREEADPERAFILVQQWLETNPPNIQKEVLLRSILERFDYMALQINAAALGESFGMSTREIYTLWHSPEYPIMAG